MSFRAIQHHNPAAFCDRVLPFLTKQECENCASIGVLDDLTSRASRPSEFMPLMLEIEHNGQIEGVFVQTILRSAMISRLNDQAVETLVRALCELPWGGQGFNGPVETVDALVRRWCEQTGQCATAKAALRVFQLTRVLQPARPPSGAMRAATAAEADVLTGWSEGFCREIGEPCADPRGNVERRTALGRLFVWFDGDRPCSMAGVAGRTPNGIRVNSVYTPPELRGRGYASALVAAVSQRMLDARRTFCFLFTDLANPISNRIYQRIGYQSVCDFRHWDIRARGDS